MVEEGNSLRDVMKDAIRNYLVEKTGLGHTVVSADIINEMVYDLADVAFKVMMMPEPLPDMPYTFCQDCAKRYQGES